MNQCTCTQRREIARSDTVIVSKCKSCQRYWIAFTADESKTAPAAMPTILLCEIIEALSRFVPKAVTS